MEHQALYRKWRPTDFDSVCGQEHITDILKYETERGLFCHAYLFCGSRGTGKTTCAKILSRAVNCENPKNGNPCGECPSCRAILDGTTTDVLEMDAASNNSVDDIRRLCEEVVYTPSMLKKKVYIIDCFSKDKTVEIAESMGATVVQHQWPGNQAEQFNWALENIEIGTEWVLRLDADEYLLPELIEELKKCDPNAIVTHFCL